ncbi:MAG: Helix-turn-helix protein, partial [Acidimicrobiaceae bacterium]|nr:Helix-turn-helix protein [Acidimicrobiaceae bacterium]
LDGVANALHLDEAEREHLFALARSAGPTSTRRTRPNPTTVRPVMQQVLDAITDAPAWIRNARHDILALNPLGRALYSPVLDSAVAGATTKRPANTTRFMYLDPAAREFFIDYDHMATDAAAMLRLEAGRNPHDKDLITLVGELSTQSELFCQHWASHNVTFHRSGRKRLRHPAVGELDLNFEGMDLPSEPELRLNVCTADPNTAAADGLKLLAIWAATRASDATNSAGVQ